MCGAISFFAILAEMNIKKSLANDIFLLRGSVVVFALNVGIAYALYPHWVTFSHLALQAYTLPFFLIAMFAAMFVLLHTGKRLTRHELHKAGYAMYVSALCMGLVVLIPSYGSGLQIALHNVAALLFVLFAATGLIWLGRKIGDHLIVAAGVIQIGICVLELVLLAIFDRYPVNPWVWVLLQLTVTLILLVSLLRVSSKLIAKIDD